MWQVTEVIVATMYVTSNRSNDHLPTPGNKSSITYEMYWSETQDKMGKIGEKNVEKLIKWWWNTVY